MNWATFRASAFPESAREKEKSRSVIFKLNRYLGIRVAYAFFVLGFSANMLSVLRVLLALVGFILFATLQTAETAVLAACGLLIFAIQVNLDFADGCIARAQKKASDFGTVIDGLANDFSRFSMMMVLGIFANSDVLLWVAVFAGFALTDFVTKTYRVFEHVEARERYLFRLSSSVVLVNLALPLALTLVHVLFDRLQTVSRFATVAYALLALLWLSHCLDEPIQGTA